MGATDKYPPIRPGGSLMLAWQIKGKPVLIIGGGNVASGRLTNLLEADAKVTLISPRTHLHPEILHRLSSLPATQLQHKDKLFEPSDLTNEYAMVLTAIDSPAASTQIWRLCKEKRIPVNVADVPSECDFYFGSQHRDGPLQIMISTNGSAPKLANLLRVRVAESLPRNAGRGCLNVGKLRRKLRGIAPGSTEGPKRMKWYKNGEGSGVLTGQDD